MAGVSDRDPFGLNWAERAAIEYEQQTRERMEAAKAERAKQVAENRRLRLERHERARAQLIPIRDKMAELAEQEGPLGAVVKLHSLRHPLNSGYYPECETCVEGYDADPMSWPCDTIETICTALGLPISDAQFFDGPLEKELHP
jgi:hypothetical protein